ncbi:MAG: hypothetical protein ABDK94_09660 [Atribacterota bacterium]
MMGEPQCFRGVVTFSVEFDDEESTQGQTDGKKEESLYQMILRARVQGELVLRPGEPGRNSFPQFFRCQPFFLLTLSESETTYCRKKGEKGEVPVRPGNWARSETTIHTSLEEEDFRIHASLDFDRHTDTYRCSFGFAGLVWKGNSILHERFYDACTGEIRESTLTSPEFSGEHFAFSTGEFQEKAADPDRIVGEKVIEPYMLGKGRVRCTFDFVRIPCQEGRNSDE